MKGLLSGLVLLGIAVAVLVSAQLTLQAQPRRSTPAIAVSQGETQARDNDHHKGQNKSGLPPLSVQDALQRPFTFPFEVPTTLTEVCQYLRKELQAPVVLDIAALERQELRADDQVQLQLEGVRLKTGLKLLLDQVGLTYQVVPEDNLLILTDTHGSTEPIDQVLSEVKALHLHVHDLQDAVDDLITALGVSEGQGGAKMRKPTIIEEQPGDTKPGEKTQQPPGSGSGSGSGSGTTERPRSRRGA
jgi:hypothetical protein